MNGRKELEGLTPTAKQWSKWLAMYTQEYTPAGSLEGISAPNSCALSTTKMLLTDHGITQFSDGDIARTIGYDPREGVPSLREIVAGLKSMSEASGVDTPLKRAVRIKENEDPQVTLDLNVLKKAVGKDGPVIVGVKLGKADHVVLVDGFEESAAGSIVLIRDPFKHPARAYKLRVSI